MAVFLRYTYFLELFLENIQLLSTSGFIFAKPKFVDFVSYIFFGILVNNLAHIRYTHFFFISIQ